MHIIGEIFVKPISVKKEDGSYKTEYVITKQYEEDGSYTKEYKEHKEKLGVIIDPIDLRDMNPDSYQLVKSLRETYIYKIYYDAYKAMRDVRKLDSKLDEVDNLVSFSPSIKELQTKQLIDKLKEARTDFYCSYDFLKFMNNPNHPRRSEEKYDEISFMWGEDDYDLIFNVPVRLVIERDF